MQRQKIIISYEMVTTTDGQCFWKKEYFNELLHIKDLWLCLCFLKFYTSKYSTWKLFYGNKKKRKGNFASKLICCNINHTILYHKHLILRSSATNLFCTSDYIGSAKSLEQLTTLTALITKQKSTRNNNTFSGL